MSVITYKSRREIEKMHAAGQVIAGIFELVGEMVRPGVSTGEIDRAVEAFILERGDKPGFKGLYGFPCTICASINEEVVHGIPGERVLRDGDLFTVDVGVVHQGYNADGARSFAVGDVPGDVDCLARATARALEAAIEVCRPGNRLSDIARAVETVGREHDYGVVEQYVGHGIGTRLHEEPQVPNFVGPDLKDMVLKAGLVVAIEPMFNLGTNETRQLGDGWTVVTADGKCSAHFEDTVAITRDGPRILTRPPGGNTRLWNHGGTLDGRQP